MPWYALFAVLLLTSCAHTVLPEFRAAQRAALADPGPPPDDWQPDAVLHLSASSVDALLAALLQEHGTLTTTLDLTVARVTPRLEVRRLKLSPSRSCEACVQVDATLDGTLRFQSPLGSGRTDLGATLAFDAVFTADRPEDAWVLSVAPTRVRDLTVTLDGAGLKGAVVPLERGLNEHLLAEVPPQPIARLGQGDLPLRAVRVVAARGARAQGAAQVHILTSSPKPGPIPVRRPIGEGWRLDLSQDSLLAIARAAAFRHGEVGMGIVPEPTALRIPVAGRVLGSAEAAVDPSSSVSTGFGIPLRTLPHSEDHPSLRADGPRIDGSTFELGLRLWRIRGRGWWRDYTVRGRVLLTRKGVELAPDEVIEGPRSKGAVFVDPLAALAEGAILKTLAQALTTTLPATHRAKGGALPIAFELLRIDGDDGLLVTDGSLQVGRRR